MDANSGMWQFWIDRGGTFTDIVARRPDGALASHKLLSENPERYRDAAIQGIRDLMGVAAGAPIPAADIATVKMGTTVATNALLERTGDRTAVAITAGFADALRIAYQNRPELFVRHIVLPEMLYERVVEVDERMDAHGQVLRPLDDASAHTGLQAAFDAGIRAVAIVFMHGYRYIDHERRVAALARDIGFTQISTSFETSPLMKLISRGDTTVVDAYLSPILRRYVDQVAAELGGTRLMFMQSNGGLTDARLFQGKDAILSGPAAGVVGAVRTAQMAGFDNIIGFDMGGTSTDVSHYNGTFERAFDTQVAGVRLRAPMMQIHTVAAGGGSILHFDGSRYRVGPDSAGADPGPACYRRGGPLTVTDCNVMLGRIQPRHFPFVFGAGGDQALDGEIVVDKFVALADEIKAATGDTRSPAEVAEGFLTIAVENMANAIKSISIQRGYDVSRYTVCTFGGAGGQHACRVADALGMTRIFVHPLAGVLSAYGMGLADVTAMRERSVEAPLDDAVMAQLQASVAELEARCVDELRDQAVASDRIVVQARAHLRYDGTDTALIVDFGDQASLSQRFEAAHRQRFGFVMGGRALVVEAVSVEAIGGMEQVADPERDVAPTGAAPLEWVALTGFGRVERAPVYDREQLGPGERIDGPAIIVEATGTNVIEPGWRAEISNRGHLVLTRGVPPSRMAADGTNVDPVMLEIFNSLFMSIAEQMGATLQNTSYSVNIKERLDFSCAVFDGGGRLIVNAPHIPVHLGSMSDSVAAIIAARGGSMRSGDVYVLNAPYNGGTHLPDVTVVTPVFDRAGHEVLFYVGSRGHHADIGGITPGSMPPHSRNVEEEGVLIDNFQLVDRGRFMEPQIRELLAGGPYPARNPDQNIGDLKAQIAANERGVQELRRMVDQFGLDVVRAYMVHVQDNAEAQVRGLLEVLSDGAFECALDNGARIRVRITIDRQARRAIIDFTGTSAQQDNNFNAPTSVTKAAVLYVFRTLVGGDIPLNDGCLKPLDIVIPDGSMLNPRYPAAVVAGNVETSQALVDSLFAALGAMAASQGTMNNLTFGNARYQYYETICGGSGAGPDFDGTDAVQTHMTNSRLTDPEVLEWRFPVMLESFAIRTGSGGGGGHTGGCGTVRRIRFLEPMTVAMLSNRRDIPPFGLAGGAPAAPGRNWVERATGRLDTLAGTDTTEVGPGDVLVVETPGGGGYGTRQSES